MYPKLGNVEYRYSDGQQEVLGDKEADSFNETMFCALVLCHDVQAGRNLC